MAPMPGTPRPGTSKAEGVTHPMTQTQTQTQTQAISVQTLKQKICDGLAVLTSEGCMDGSGHISVRIPGTETFLINPRYAGALADVDDICTVDVKECKRLAGEGPIPSESHIHAAVY